MSTYLAIDGGNSKTDVVIGTTEGAVLATTRGRGTCYQTAGLDTALNRLRSLVDEARVAAGLPLDFRFARADVFLAGADLPEEVTMLHEQVARLDWSPILRVDNDTFALLRVGTDAPDAVAVICGAGINCVGRSATGRTARFPSLGQLTGDWGGGGHLASLTLWHAVRGDDGRGPHTAISAAVATHFGYPSAEAVAAAVHLGSLDHDRLNELTPVLFQVATAGDPVARGVVAQQANEIALMATTAAGRLGLLDSPFSVVLGGGVLRARHALLLDAIDDQLHASAPKAAITVVDAPPVLGAALSCLDALGADDAAHVALRDAFRKL